MVIDWTEKGQGVNIMSVLFCTSLSSLSLSNLQTAIIMHVINKAKALKAETKNSTFEILSKKVLKFWGTFANRGARLMDFMDSAVICKLKDHPGWSGRQKGIRSNHRSA